MTAHTTIKERLNIRTVITTETGREMKGKHLEECPFCHGHECFSIREDKRDFHCYQCSPNVHGDVIDFLGRFYSLSAGEALKKAAELAGVSLESCEKPPAQLTPVEQIRKEAADYYHAHMLENGGKGYLVEKRGHRMEVLQELRVGWSDGRLVDHLRHRGFSDRNIIESGLARERDEDKKVVDFFSPGLVIYPHLSAGRVLHFTIKDPEKKRKPYQLPADKRSKKWVFYNQDALDRFTDIILVEGENDLQSVKDAGAGYVAAMIGQISDEQIKALSSRCKGKRLFLWVDNDAGGEKYIRKICREIEGVFVRIMVYGKAGDDPDAYLQTFTGDRLKEIKRLQLQAVDYLTWEILEAGKLPDLESRLKALDKHEVFERITDCAGIDQEIYLEKLGKLGFSRQALEEKLGASQELAEKIEAYLGKLDSPRHANPRDLAEMIFSDCEKRGFTFVDAVKKTFFLHRGELFEVSNNLPFNAYLFQRSGGELLITKEPGRSTWEALRNLIYQRGRRVSVATWIHADTSTKTFHLNFSSPANQIIRVAPGKVETVLNGQNEQGVLLRGSRRIAPFSYLPEADTTEALQSLQELVFDNLATEKELRFFILAWLISGFLSDYSPYQVLVKFSGGSGSGKTTAARLLSVLLYGEQALGDPSGAAAYSVAAANPLLVIDNLESGDISKAIEKFLLLAATGGSRQKRASGTDTDVVEESVKALICITSIEPFSKPELINRCFDVDFSSGHWRPGFIEQAAIEGLKAKRDVILSGLLNFTAHEILPRLDQRMDYLKKLKANFPNHSKQRADEYLALLCLIVERLVMKIPYFDADDVRRGHVSETDEIIAAWISGQNSKAREQEVNSSSILSLMDGLVREYVAKMAGINPTPHKDYQQPVMSYIHPDYHLEGIKYFDRENAEEPAAAYFEITCTGADLWAAIVKYCKNSGHKVPFENQGVFFARLRDSYRVLMRGQWQLIESEKEDQKPYFRKVNGRRYWRFRKLLDL